MPHRRGFILSGSLLLGLGLLPARALGEGLSPPAGDVILTVTGAISSTNRRGRAEFDGAMLEELGLVSLTTWTPYTEGPVEFEGVLGRRLMAAVGASGTETLAIALNDFQSTIPLADFHEYDVLLAVRMNGRALRVRDKGPIWIVYPWSDHPELNDLRTRGKSVWQLRTMHVR